MPVHGPIPTNTFVSGTYILVPPFQYHEVHLEVATSPPTSLNFGVEFDEHVVATSSEWFGIFKPINTGIDMCHVSKCHATIPNMYFEKWIKILILL